jgi:formylglycine-generating enzyme required for sulfatase activity
MIAAGFGAGSAAGQDSGARPQGSVAASPTNCFENSLGMRFVPVPGSKAWFSIWETRVRDYAAFRSETERPWTEPSFGQGPDHPIVNVSWEDAEIFCRWLTKKELQTGRLHGKDRFRLPSDAEWSLAVGLRLEQGQTPEDRMKTAMVWPWGYYWPPRVGDGNFAQELKVDTFSQTSPVGSFKTSPIGLYDLAGNVWEWCEDWYNETHVTRVLRGGSFNDSLPLYLLSNYRFSGTMNLSNDDIGFRVVLERNSGSD